MKDRYGPPDLINKQLHIMEFDKHVRNEIDKMRKINPKPKLPSGVDYEDLLADIEDEAREIFDHQINSDLPAGPAYEYLKSSKEDLMSSGGDGN